MSATRSHGDGRSRVLAAVGGQHPSCPQRFQRTCSGFPLLSAASLRYTSPSLVLHAFLGTLELLKLGQGWAEGPLTTQSLSLRSLSKDPWHLCRLLPDCRSPFLSSLVWRTPELRPSSNAPFWKAILTFPSTAKFKKSGCLELLGEAGKGDQRKCIAAPFIGDT